MTLILQIAAGIVAGVLALGLLWILTALAITSPGTPQSERPKRTRIERIVTLKEDLKSTGFILLITTGIIVFLLAVYWVLLLID